MANTQSFFNTQSSNLYQQKAKKSLKSGFPKPQKVISSLIIEEESQKVFLALNIENHLYLWFLKNEVIEAVSLLDEIENEERKYLFPDLGFDFSAFISEYFNFPKERKIFISSFGFLRNSNFKFIKVTGNFDSLLIESALFLDYLKSEFKNNHVDLNNYESLLSDSVNMEEKELKSNFKIEL